VFDDVEKEGSDIIFGFVLWVSFTRGI